MSTSDFLLEIGTEELPPKQIQTIAAALAQSLSKEFSANALNYVGIKSYATPRRVAVLVTALANTQAGQIVERRGPALRLAFTAEGTPTEVARKFALSCGIDVSQLTIQENDKGKWVVAKIIKSQEATSILLPRLVTNAIATIPLAKSMRWGDSNIEFVRPVHWVTMLYGTAAIVTTILGVTTSNLTYGHRFHHPEAIALTNAADYETILETKGYVIADFERRKEIIRAKTTEAAATIGEAVIHSALLEEVTGLIEWPEVLLGKFDSNFLQLPHEVLITVLEQQQRCFPVVNLQGELSHYFIAISNIHSKRPEQVIAGNERVIKARLTDADFFYRSNNETLLSDYLPKLKVVIFQDKLGTLSDKTLRLVELSQYLAAQLNLDQAVIMRAAQLSKTDLMTPMVGEFPELQGIIGYYYALAQQEEVSVAIALKEHYLPRFADDELPATTIGAALALADRADTLVGMFGINKLPTGEKDPLGLRRAALGIIRIILVKNLSLDLLPFLQMAQKNYRATLENTAAATQVLDFIFERLRNWYGEHKINLNTFNAVLACRPTNLIDFDQRIRALEYFRTLPAAESLSSAHKRINNILNKVASRETLKFDAKLLQTPAEKELYAQLTQKAVMMQSLCASASYQEALTVLADLKSAIDNFFNTVMVMVDNPQLRENRLALLSQLHELFRMVADLSLLYAVM